MKDQLGPASNKMTVDKARVEPGRPSIKLADAVGSGFQHMSSSYAGHFTIGAIERYTVTPESARIHGQESSATRGPLDLQSCRAEVEELSLLSRPPLVPGNLG